MAGQMVTFLREFARNPMRTGAVMPSSRRLATQMIASIPTDGKPVVVELGPGTGACTGAIQERLDGRGHHLAVELNPRFATLLADRFPAVDIAQADAATLPDLLRSRGLEHADTIISGLPWTAFPAALQNTLLDAVTTALSPDGSFTTFAYVHALRLPPARRFRARLEALFADVVIGRTVWRNIPPALTYTARGPRTGAG